MYFRKLPNDIIALTNEFGSWEFKNIQKFYKFQVLCKHPGIYTLTDNEMLQTICERCNLLLKEEPLIKKT